MSTIVLELLLPRVGRREHLLSARPEALLSFVVSGIDRMDGTGWIPYD
jgi:hypothetical protein